MVYLAILGKWIVIRMLANVTVVGIVIAKL